MQTDCDIINLNSRQVTGGFRSNLCRFFFVKSNKELLFKKYSVHYSELRYRDNVCTYNDKLKQSSIYTTEKCFDIDSNMNLQMGKSLKHYQYNKSQFYFRKPFD